MIYSKERFGSFFTEVEYSNFSADDSEVQEQMFVIRPFVDKYADFKTQLERVNETFCQIMTKSNDFVPVFVRVFVSDATNQEPSIKETFKLNCPLSIIEQPPLDGNKLTLWAYVQKGIQTEKLSNGLFKVSHNGYEHLWSSAIPTPQGDSKEQTRELLNNYVSQLSDQGCTLLADTIRTWFFVQNVDVNYAGVVVGRNEVFDQEGLTDDTHFISSTGIQGRKSDYHITSVMDAYSVKGLKREQIQFLYAPTHLNNTAEYGVRFERGTAVHYGDRTHTFISGTASINNKGDVVYVGDIYNQTLRMIENVEKLLLEADCTMGNVAQIIIYLRDIADYKEVKKMFDNMLADIPKVFVLAPVCRPTWLIEMECIAIKANTHKKYAKY